MCLMLWQNNLTLFPGYNMLIWYERYNSTCTFCEFDLWFANLQPQVDVNETFIARSEIIQIMVFFSS